MGDFGFLLNSFQTAVIGYLILEECVPASTSSSTSEAATGLSPSTHVGSFGRRFLTDLTDNCCVSISGIAPAGSLRKHKHYSTISKVISSAVFTV